MEGKDAVRVGEGWVREPEGPDPRGREDERVTGKGRVCVYDVHAVRTLPQQRLVTFEQPQLIGRLCFHLNLEGSHTDDGVGGRATESGPEGVLY